MTGKRKRKPQYREESRIEDSLVCPEAYREEKKTLSPEAYRERVTTALGTQFWERLAGCLDVPDAVLLAGREALRWYLFEKCLAAMSDEETAARLLEDEKPAGQAAGEKRD